MNEVGNLEPRGRDVDGALESLGVLAAAAAHDFNNYLTGILGNAGMVLRRLPQDSSCRPLVEEIEKAAQHAAALSSQILACSGRGTSAAPSLEARLDAGEEVAEGPLRRNFEHRPPSLLAGRSTVLVVDDEEIIRDVAQSILVEFGYDVLIAEDGLRALEVFEEHAGTIDAVLLDVAMPRLDGAETFRALRQLQPDLKIVFSSGFDNETAVDRFIGEEAVGFIQKPYRPAQLVDKVREVIRG